VTTGRETSLDPAALAARIGQAVADAIAPIVVDALESARREPTTSDTRTQGSPLCDLPPVFGFLELQRALPCIGRTTLWEAVRHGDLPCKRVGRRVLFTRASVEAWLTDPQPPRLPFATSHPVPLPRRQTAR
jgi:excisionase family DNA binding protein